MQTSPVLNQANLQAPPASAAKASGSDGSVTPFNQMLSREMADRHDAAQAQGPQQANGTTPGKPADAAKAKDAKASGDKSGDGAKTDDAKTDSATPSDAAAQAPADMLALVANLNQVRQDAKAVTAAATQPDTSATAIAADAKKALPSTVALTDATAAGVRGKKGEDPIAADANGGAQAELKAAPDAPKADSLKGVADLTAKEQETLVAAASAPPEKSDFTAALKDSLANAPAPQSVQQAALPLAQAVAAPGADKLAPPVGSPGWDQALGQKVVWMVAGGQQSASLTLNPPDLGPMQVVISVHNSTAHATFTAAQPEVRQALEAAMPKLRDMLGNAGIQLGQANVNSGSSNQHTPERRPAPGVRGVGHVDGGSETPLQVGRVQPAASGIGLVDTFV